MNARSPVRSRLLWMVGCAALTALPVTAGTAQSPDSHVSTRQTTASSTTQRLDQQTSRAAQWGLDDTEWQRYRTLMQGIRGSVSPASLSPIEVLGIHARSTEELQRYAEQWAVLMREDAERILAFQRAYDDAQRRLFPNSVLIDARVVASSKSAQKLKEKMPWLPDDRVLFFTDTQCASCDAVLERLVGQLPQFSGIDLYLTDVSAGEESLIREWAASKQIDPRWIKERKVTLNIDAGARNRIAAHTGQLGQALPVLVLRQGDQFMPLPVSRF
ncbi:MAG: TIGR03759 family integrating conjugative element protein [Gammaproteobacteria bacterium]|nr:TIGR03759 family integrating conjugative element protein [Gammaproteobacteria bacterium]